MRWFLPIALSVAVVVARACGGGDGLLPREGGEDLRLPTHEPWDEGMAALVDGVVEFDESTGCVILAGRYGYRSRIV